MWFDSWIAKNNKYVAAKLWDAMYGGTQDFGLTQRGSAVEIDWERVVIGSASAHRNWTPKGWLMMLELPDHGVWYGISHETPRIYDKQWCWDWWAKGNHKFKPGQIVWHHTYAGGTGVIYKIA